MLRPIHLFGYALSALTVVGLSAANANARSPIDACANDSYTQGRIDENVPLNERLDVVDQAGRVVGAVHYDAPTGDLGALYLCGANSGYYYLRGNINEDMTALWNDEYESDFSTIVTSQGIDVTIKSIRDSAGEPESADYQPFGGRIFIKRK